MKKNNSGFTLVELMVVVGIIGILSAVAVPTFRKYQMKSRWTEAKIYLGQVYLGEQTAFHDWGTYVTCLPSTGVPNTVYDTWGNIDANCATTYKGLCDERANRYYTVGFDWNGGNATWGNQFVHDNFTPDCRDVYIFGPIHTFSGEKLTSRCKEKWDAGIAWTTAQPYNFLTQNTFQAIAYGGVGDCPGSFAAAPADGVDIWTMNEQKELRHAKIGK